MPKKTLLSAEISLPYHKQGDDLGQYLRGNSSILKALEAHARNMDFAAKMLRDIKEMIADSVSEVRIDADTHVIEISGPPPVIEKLITAKLAYKVDDEFDDEDFDDDEEWEDEDSDE